MLTIGWRGALMVVGFLGVPVVASILLQSGILKDQARHEPTYEGAALGGRQLLTSGRCCCSLRSSRWGRWPAAACSHGW
jgi:hypothetical protein